MNEKHTKKHKVRGKTDWNKVKSFSEEQVISAAKADSDAKLPTKAQLKKFKRVHPPLKEEIDVKAIREKLHLLQEEFAHYFGVNVRTI